MARLFHINHLRLLVSSVWQEVRSRRWSFAADSANASGPETIRQQPRRRHEINVADQQSLLSVRLISD